MRTEKRLPSEIAYEKARLKADNLKRQMDGEKDPKKWEKIAKSHQEAEKEADEKWKRWQAKIK